MVRYHSAVTLIRNCAALKESDVFERPLRSCIHVAFSVPNGVTCSKWEAEKTHSRCRYRKLAAPDGFMKGDALELMGLHRIPSY